MFEWIIKIYRPGLFYPAYNTYIIPVKYIPISTKKLYISFTLHWSVLLNQRRWERRVSTVCFCTFIIQSTSHLLFFLPHKAQNYSIFYVLKSWFFTRVRKCTFLRKAFITLFLWFPWTHAIWISWLLISIDSKTHKVQLPPHTWDWNCD